ncbi:TetR/AcrR family transcriptional regulator [Curtobacterium sp. MCSS17_015]|uniref:TetR/AcrR family transcriptional regulator n=1 Tax=Curtobacterium sp. MCSS17_015 TaxID=2175666 RepID=UPI000DA82781|nr:TetR/AcrR family transcriptional regulator [Curtobacterium sp. MCSS17_015]WIB27159.1 TetR/AcrR family transcriptional regulator [Curtobacterium sp. MCSS17_015]
MPTTATPAQHADTGGSSDTTRYGSVRPGSTGPCTLRERKKQQTRQAIHDAALTRITEQGLDGVTVEQICADADVSPRTFFNYFSSKAHAAIGLDTVEVPDAVRDRFATADGRLIDDVCELVADTVPLSADRARAKELLVRRPEMTSMVMRWMAESRQALIAVVTTRTDEDTARTAVALVMSALSEAAHRFSVQSQADLAARLRAVVAEMVALATAAPQQPE